MAQGASSIPRRVLFVGDRLDRANGISAASKLWQGCLADMGCAISEVTFDEQHERDIRNGLAEADLVVVENSLSGPPSDASVALARELAGRPALLRHHDLPWQRPLSERGASPPPDDPRWLHVTINERSRLELSAQGIRAVTVYNRFDTASPSGARAVTRERLGIGADELVVLQPTRATPQKNVAGGLRLAHALGATYWLLGAEGAKDREELDRLARALGSNGPARGVIAGNEHGVGLSDAYASADAVVLPSSWEGFGNAAIEAAIFRRPLAISNFPVSSELRRYCFGWFPSDDARPLAGYLSAPDDLVVERNAHVAEVRFSAVELPRLLRDLLTEVSSHR
jgi:glycosyltransferase involved in cell wall biosynthesis